MVGYFNMNILDYQKTIIKSYALQIGYSPDVGSILLLAIPKRSAYIYFHPRTLAFDLGGTMGKRMAHYIPTNASFDPKSFFHKSYSKMMNVIKNNRNYLPEFEKEYISILEDQRRNLI